MKIVAIALALTNLYMQEYIFKFNQTGVTTEGKVLGEVSATGIRPNFTPRLIAAGFNLNAEIFAPKPSANQNSRR